MLYGGVAAGQTNPFWVTGSVTIPSPIIQSGSVAGLLQGGQPVSAGNPVQVQTFRPATSNISFLTASVTSQLLTGSNSSRVGLTVFNNSTANAWVRLGGPVQTNAFSFKMTAGDYYETPYGYTGRLDILWATATGSAMLTEVTA